MSKNANRWRCLISGCNPLLASEAQALAHKEETRHRVAKWPVRSAQGEKLARIRNRTGYYDKYNVSYKAAENRFPDYSGDDDHPFSAEALGQD